MSPAFAAVPQRQPQVAARAAGTPQGWGKSAKYDFDNPAKWETVTDVPVLDEHEMTGSDGSPLSYVDANVLQEIAANNNRRVLETGDPAPLIVGHTTDDPHAPEKPVVGYAVNYRVKPFRRDPETGQVVYAIHADYKVRSDRKHVINDFPRRSVELWVSKKELDPIALLGGTTPERDLGVVIRNSRAYFGGGHLEAVSLLGDTPPARDLGNVFHYSRRHGGMMLRYSMAAGGKKMATNCAPQGRVKKYEADPMGMPGAGPDDEFGTEGMEGEGGSSNPLVGEILAASKEFKGAIRQAMMEVIQELEGGGEEGGMEGGQPGGTEPPMPQGGPEADGGMPGEGGELGPDDGDPDEEARRMHGEEPQQYESTGMPGPMNTRVTGMGTKGTRYSRESNMNGQRQQPRQGNPDVVRLSRQVQSLAQSNQSLVAKLARADAEKLVNSLEQQHRIQFADKDQEVQLLASLDESSRESYVENVIKKNYRRLAADPARPAFPGTAQYARTGEANPADPESFEPNTPQEAQHLADMRAQGKPLTEAVKLLYARRKQA